MTTSEEARDERPLTRGPGASRSGGPLGPLHPGRLPLGLSLLWLAWGAASPAFGQAPVPGPVPEAEAGPAPAPAPSPAPAPALGAEPPTEPVPSPAPAPVDTAAPVGPGEQPVDPGEQPVDPVPTDEPLAPAAVDTAPAPVDTGMPAAVPDPAPGRLVDDPTLWLFVGPPPNDEPAPEPVAAPIVWEGPPLLVPPVEPVPVPLPEPAVPAPQAPGLDDRIAAELRDNVVGLERLLTTWTLAGLLLVLGIGVGGYRVAVRLADAARDAGYDLDRRLVGLRVVAAAAATLWVGGFVARLLLERVPLLGAALIGVFLAGVAVVVARQAVQALGGMVLVFGAQVREGDRLTVGEVAGTVEHAGFLRLRLRRPDGSTVFLPAQALDDGPVTVSSPRRTQAVRVRVAGAVGPEEREAVRRKALLCPYRQAESEVRLERPEGEEGALEVVVQAWSASAAEAAERWLRKALA